MLKFSLELELKFSPLLSPLSALREDGPFPALGDPWLHTGRPHSAFIVPAHLQGVLGKVLLEGQATFLACHLLRWLGHLV